MECLLQNKVNYIGECHNMGKHKKKKDKTEQIENNIACTQTDESPPQNYVIPQSTLKILSAIIGSCIALVSGVAIWALSQIYEFKGIITENSIEINALSNQITNLENSTNQMNELLNGITETDGICTRLAIIENKLNTFENKLNIFEDKLNIFEDKLNVLEDKLNIPTISASKDIMVSVEKVSIEPMLTSSPQSSITSDTKIGVDANGNVYIADELINETILLTYIDEDKEVYFLGQYDDNYKWNDFCVTNAYYFDGSFYSICESDFEHGKRLNYKSIVYQPDDDDWLYSNRTCEENGNIGITVHYSFDYKNTKNFTKTNARIVNILFVDKFLESVPALMTKYYSGNTSNSFFNDTSGNAYRVTYNEDLTVKSLYVGNFVDGYFNDNTGNAWQIIYLDNIKCYIYNKGQFKDGVFIGDSSYQISIDEINEIVSKYDFECELKWKEN